MGKCCTYFSRDLHLCLGRDEYLLAPVWVGRDTCSAVFENSSSLILCYLRDSPDMDWEGPAI